MQLGGYTLRHILFAGALTTVSAGLRKLEPPSADLAESGRIRILQTATPGPFSIDPVAGIIVPYIKRGP